MIFAFSLSSGKWNGLCAVRQPLQLGWMRNERSAATHNRWSGYKAKPQKTTFEGVKRAEGDGVGLEHTFLYLIIVALVPADTHSLDLAILIGLALAPRPHPRVLYPMTCVHTLILGTLSPIPNGESLRAGKQRHVGASGSRRLTSLWPAASGEGGHRDGDFIM